MTRIKGIDISRAQEIFDFEKAVADGVQFVIIRAGIRTDADTYFERNVSECDRLNIPYGLYWFFEATDSATFERELSACIKTIQGKKPLYPVFIDMETRAQMDNLTNKERTDMAVKFCETVKENGFPSGIYANPNWLENYYEKSEILGKYDLWLANWTENPNVPTRYDYGQKIWQWGKDVLSGKEVDGDISYVDYAAVNADIYDKEKPLATGDKITLYSAPLYVSATAKIRANTVSGSYWIQSGEVINGRIRITTPKGNNVVTGWVNVSDTERTDDSTSEANAIRVGDKVMVKRGALTYTGGQLAPFVYDTVYTVIQAGLALYPDYIVIGLSGRVTAAVNADDLILV